MTENDLSRMLEQERQRSAELEEKLRLAHEELERTNSELLQLTLELEDRVAERTAALESSREELRRHRDHLQEMVDERTNELRSLNQTLKEKLDELRASEERFRSLVYTVPDIVYRINKDGTFSFVNEAVRRIGYEPEELMGRHFSEIVIPEEVETVSRDRVLPKLKGTRTGPDKAPKLFDERRSGDRRTTGLVVHLVAKDRQVEQGVIHPLGADRIVAEINSAGVYGIGDNDTFQVFIGTVGVIRDISRHKELEKELRNARDTLEEQVEQRTMELQLTNKALFEENKEREKVEKRLHQLYHELEKSQAQRIQAEKLSALGTLTAGIAHELNNPMMGLINFIQYCRKKTPEDDVRHAVLRDAEHESKRCADILRSLLQFSREEPEKEPFRHESCLEILDRVLRLLSYRIEKEGVRVTRGCTSDPPLIPVKAGGLQQVFLNLLTNALDALKDQERKEIVFCSRTGAGMLEIEVRDTGCGIPSEKMSRIFDPFFTTKPVGAGTGLGLSVCRSIVEEHRGSITCESDPGGGTKFMVRLPMEQPGV